MSDTRRVEVFWSEEDGCWIAVAPEMRGCSAHGDTRAQALAELEVALKACDEAGP